MLAWASVLESLDLLLFLVVGMLLSSVHLAGGFCSLLHYLIRCASGNSVGGWQGGLWRSICDGMVPYICTS